MGWPWPGALGGPATERESCRHGQPMELWLRRRAVDTRLRVLATAPAWISGSTQGQLRHRPGAISVMP